MVPFVLNGLWNQSNAGGCSNNPTFGLNPAWAVHITQETEVLMRLSIVAQSKAGHGETIDPDQFKACIGMSLFRINQNTFPVAPNTIQVSSLKHPTLETHDGHYTWNLSAAVSKKTKVAEGVYILVPATFEPHCYAQFQINLYCAGNFMKVAPYTHSN